MSQIKKKFIESAAVDGSKIKLLNADALKATKSDGSEQKLLELDSTDALKLYKLPVLPSAPTVDGHASTKKYVDDSVASEASSRASAISAEASARGLADSELDSKIATEKGRIDAILLASDADKDSFAEIVNLINSVDTANDSAFASYVLSNDAALAAEVSARQSADSALDGRLDVLEADPTTKTYVDGQISTEQGVRDAADSALSDRLDIVEGDDTVVGSIEKAKKDAKTYADGIVGSEASTRAAADTALDARLDVLEGPDSMAGSVAKALKDAKLYSDAAVSQEASDRATAVSAEATARASADNVLDGKIATEKGRIDAILLASDADKDSFAEIVQLINSVDTANDNAFASYVISNNAALAQEVSDRQSGDNALDARLDVLEGADTVAGSVAKALKDAKAYTDVEQGRAQGAESALSARIDALELDPVTLTAVNAAVAAEQARAVEVESGLDSRVTTLEMTQPYWDAAITVVGADGLVKPDGTVIFETGTEFMLGSEMVFVNGMMLMPFGATQEYYLVSTPGNYSICFVNEFAVGGLTQISEGDRIHVKYMIRPTM